MDNSTAYKAVKIYEELPVIFFVLGIALVGGVGYYAYNKYFKSKIDTAKKIGIF